MKRERHGESKNNITPEYRAWQAMISRCRKSNKRSRKFYYDRGVHVCRQWIHSFPNFLKHVGRKPTPKHTLDRFPNNRGNYEPGNVRWATVPEQANNKRDNVVVEFNGVTKTARQWEKDLGFPRSLIHTRLGKMGWSVEQALTTPKLETFGSLNHASKLTEEKVCEIRRKYVPRTYGTIKLAKEFGVTQACIMRVVSRKGWKHVS